MSTERGNAFIQKKMISILILERKTLNLHCSTYPEIALAGKITPREEVMAVISACYVSSQAETTVSRAVSKGLSLKHGTGTGPSIPCHQQLPAARPGRLLLVSEEVGAEKAKHRQCPNCADCSSPAQRSVGAYAGSPNPARAGRYQGRG